jgi:hypothetical protein
MIFVPSDTILAAHREKMEVYLHHNRFIKDFRKEVPIHLIVHTSAAFEKFLPPNGMFSQEITNKGIVLYPTNQ